MTDDFAQHVKTQVAGRVGWICSNPNCLQPTSGPSETAKTVTNVGQAAHITAAAPTGARFDASLTSEQRKSADNGIWLCARCAKFIDDDAITYPVSLLREWKAVAEARARQAIERGPQPQQTASGPATDAAALSREATILLLNACKDRQGMIFASEMVHYFVVQTNDRDFAEPKDARTVARWRAAVRELESLSAIEQTDTKGEIFHVTDSGYQLADKLHE